MMTEEKIMKLKRFGKRSLVGFLSFVLAVEQVPWGNVWPLITSHAAVDPNYVPALYGAFKLDKSQDVALDDTAITLSKKTQAAGSVKIEYDSVAADYKIKGMGVHVDTPTIFYNPRTNEYTVKNVSTNTYNSTTGITEHYGPEQYAQVNDLTIVGGVEVAFPGLNTDIWRVYNSAKTQSLEKAALEAALDEEDKGDEEEITADKDSDTADTNTEPSDVKNEDEGSRDSEEKPSDQTNRDEEDTSRSDAENKDTSSDKNTSDEKKEDATIAGENEKNIDKNTEKKIETVSSKTDENITDAEEGDASGSTQKDARAAEKESVTEDAATKPEETEAPKATEETSENETTGASSEETAEKETSKEETEKATEEEKDNEKAESSAAEETAEAESTTAADEKKTQETATATDEEKTQTINDEIDTYDASDDKDNYHYVLAPDDTQMIKGTEDNPGSANSLQYYRGNVRVDYINGDYTPTTNISIPIKLKFWINRDENGKLYSLPEGLSADCWSWIHNEGYEINNVVVDPSSNQGVSIEGKYAIAKQPRRDTSAVQLLYSNIDWNIDVQTVKGAKDDPVITWQKNNYASYLMSIENTSGLEDGKLPEDESNWVPDTTLFSNYDVTVEVPNTSHGHSAFANTSQYVRYFMNEDGSLTENPNYYDPSQANSDAFYGGKWIANDLSNVGYDITKYDESGGAVILDVTNLSETDRLLENPDDLIQRGAKVIGYQWTTGATFIFTARNQILYPPQFSSKYNDELKGKPEEEKITQRFYRVYTPFSNSVTVADNKRGVTVTEKVRAKGTIYFGGSADAAAGQNLLEEEKRKAVAVDEETESNTETKTTEAENTDTAETENADTTEVENAEKVEADQETAGSAETGDASDPSDEEDDYDDTIFADEPGWVVPSADELWNGIAVTNDGKGENSKDTASLGHRWSQSTNALVYIHVPEYNAAGTKTVETKEAYVGKEITYTIKDIGIGSDDGVAGSAAAPMYRPNVVDTLPDGFDLQKLQFVLPKSMADTGYEGYNTPADYWMGGTDDLLGTGIVGDPEKKVYSPLEYQDKNGDWIPLEGLTFEKVEPESGENVTVKTETGTEPGVIYSCDVKDAFEQIGDYSRKIRINFRCYWVPLTSCVGYIRLIGVSRVAGERTNTAVTSFTILNYEDKRNQEALDDGQLTDQAGYFNVGLAEYNGRISTPSEARKDVNKSDIWAEANVETEIRKRHKVDKDLLETPITMEYGNYLLKFGNRSLAEGYNIDFTFNLEKEVDDERQEAISGSKVDGFMTEGIRISKKLLEAGEQPYLRDDISADKQPITKKPAPMLSVTYADGTKKNYTLSDLLGMITDTKDKLKDTINPHDEYLGNSVYIDLRDSEGKAVHILKFKLSFSSFYGKDVLEKQTDGEMGDPEKNPQDEQWMRIYGASSNICTATGTLDYNVAGWKNRITGQIVADDKNIYGGTDKGALKFIMANPTIDINVVWHDDDTKKDYSSKQQAVPYQQPFWYDITLGNASPAILFEGHVNLEFDMNRNSETPYDELKHKGFVMDYLELDMSHIKDAGMTDYWGNLDGIDFYDVENEGEKAVPKVRLEWDDISQYVDPATHILKLPRSAVYQKADDDTWQIGRLDLQLGDMDPEMLPAHYEDMDGDGTAETYVKDKLFHCKVYGHASLYEKDLELKNDFTAESRQGAVYVKYTQTAVDDGGKDANGDPLGIKKLYVDPNASVTIDLKNGFGSRQVYYAHSNNGYEREYFNILKPSGITGYRKDAYDMRKYITYRQERADMEHTIRSNLTNYLTTAPVNSSNRASALIAGELEMKIPSWLNDGKSADKVTAAEGGNTLDLLTGRKEGFVPEKIVIPKMLDKTGEILSITMEGYRADGTTGAVHVITWDEINKFYYNASQNEYVIPASVWEKQGTSTEIQQEAVVLPTKYTVKFENFSGNVQNTPVYVDLVGVTPYGGNYKFEASFRTEDKRPGEIENRKGTDEHDKWNVKRPAEQYYGEDLDKFYLCTIDTDQLYLESDASYKAFQASSSNARKLQGYDQHA